MNETVGVEEKKVILAALAERIQYLIRIPVLALSQVSQQIWTQTHVYTVKRENFVGENGVSFSIREKEKLIGDM